MGEQLKFCKDCKHCLSVDEMYDGWVCIGIHSKILWCNKILKGFKERVTGKTFAFSKEDLTKSLEFIEKSKGRCDYQRYHDGYDDCGEKGKHFEAKQ